MIDRTLAPAFGQVENIDLLHAMPYKLDNGLQCFVIDGGDQDLVRIEFIFSNVEWDMTKPLQAFATNTLLNDGTSQYSAAQIADKVDYYGAFLQTEYNFDQVTVTLYTLNKHLKSTLPIVKAILTDSIFPQREIETFILNQKQKLSVNMEKNDFVGRKVFNEALFGNTLYGYDIDAAAYDHLNRSQVAEYFRKAYQPQNCTLIIAGKVKNETLQELNNIFGIDWNNAGVATPNSFTFGKAEGAEHYVEKKDALQSAIRIGQIAINRGHTDFPGFQVLNTILGGYFGSRLMANIREDKGFTYGIGSALVSLKNTGYFFIASEVGADVCSQAMSEIEKEVNLLKDQKVSDGELDLVRNYMLGSMLGSLENALSHADKFKNIYFSGLDYDYYDTYIRVVRNITPDDIIGLANKYLNFENFQKVIIGKK
ncbi:insulinase family protein [Flavihumibacter sp. R14]|nr:insulinase family protein [Flavihumibacter soli]